LSTPEIELLVAYLSITSCSPHCSTECSLWYIVKCLSYCRKPKHMHVTHPLSLSANHQKWV